MEHLHQTFPGNYYLLGKLSAFLRNFYFLILFFAGDSGYPLRPWLLIPVLEYEDGSPEDDYNQCQRTTRNVVERVNGVLKARFRCLLKHRVLPLQATNSLENNKYVLCFTQYMHIKQFARRTSGRK